MRKNKKKYFSILGDSISTLYGYNPLGYEVFYDWERKNESGIYMPTDTWWGQVIEEFDGELLVNNSWSGSTVFRHPKYEIQSYGCSDERTSSLGRDGISPDVIIVYIGTNDWGRGVRISAFQAEDKYDTSYFLSAYRLMLKKIKKNYPNAEIWCVSLAVSCCNKMSDFSFNYNHGGIGMKCYCDAIEQCVKEAKCKYIDLYRHCAPYDTIDGFHPNAGGMKTIAQAIISEIKSDSNRYDYSEPRSVSKAYWVKINLLRYIQKITFCFSSFAEKIKELLPHKELSIDDYDNDCDCDYDYDYEIDENFISYKDECMFYKYYELLDYLQKNSLNPSISKEQYDKKLEIIRCYCEQFLPRTAPEFDSIHCHLPSDAIIPDLYNVNPRSPFRFKCDERKNILYLSDNGVTYDYIERFYRNKTFFRRYFAQRAFLSLCSKNITENFKIIAYDKIVYLDISHIDSVAELTQAVKYMSKFVLSLINKINKKT